MADLKDLKDRIWLGVVEDNNDPKRLGRVKVRVMDVFDDIPLEAIPWATPFKDKSGTSFSIPDVGKVISVVFEEGIYYPEYLYSQHHNPNLQEKLNRMSEDDYLSFGALAFDDYTQIYVNESEGLKLDYKYNNINVQKDFIALNLKDNTANLYLGDANASQQAILGNKWMEWFDLFVSNLLGENAGPYLGNFGAPVIANPAMIQILLEYKAKRGADYFLSDHVHIVDDQSVTEVNDVKKDLRVDIDQVGDEWTSTVTDNTVERKGVDNSPQAGQANKSAPNEYVPPGLDSTSDGTNTTPSDDEASVPDPDPNSLEANEELQKIINAMERKNYKVYTRALEPNIVGIRKKKHGKPVTNKFDEEMHYFYVDENGGWVHRKFTVTTVPGLDKKNGKKLTVLPWRDSDNSGVSVLVPGQYQDYYKIDIHGKKSKYPYYALTSVKAMPVMRQKKDSDYYDFKGNITVDGWGINIHASGPYKKLDKDPLKDSASGEGYDVYNWSHGCQVFKKYGEYKKFMRFNYAFREKYGQNSFTYTLMLDTDII